MTCKFDVSKRHETSRKLQLLIDFLQIEQNILMHFIV
jgi:hypothetical protein